MRLSGEEAELSSPDLNTYSNIDHSFTSATSRHASCPALHCTAGLLEGMRRQEQLQTHLEARVLIVGCLL